MVDLPVTPSCSLRRLSPLQKDLFLLGMMCGDRESSLSREVLSWLPPSRWKRWKCQSFMRRGEENRTQSSSPRLDSLGRTPRPSVLLAEVGAHLLSYPHSGLYAGRSRLRVGVANRGKRSIKLMND